MARIQRSVTIHCPVPEVFSYMDDIAREHEWQPNLRAASQEPTGPVGVGTLKRYTSTFLKKEITNVYRITAYEMYVRVAYESTPESAVQAAAEMRWEPIGAGTRVVMTIDAVPGRALKLVPSRVLEKASTTELERMLECLKSKLESA